MVEGNGGKRGLSVQRHFSRDGVDPLYTGLDGKIVNYMPRVAEIFDRSDPQHPKTVFKQEGVEFPEGWSQTAVDTVASKYFYGEKDTSERETSVKQLVGRVSEFGAVKGGEAGYFATPQDAKAFGDEVATIMINQVACPNSPVLFNAGIFLRYGIKSGGEGHFRWDSQNEKVVPVIDGQAYEWPQAAACFIEAVSDHMKDIMRVAVQEAMLFKYGSGAGADLSGLRSSRERLTGGGSPSGPVTFMRIYDQVADVVRSGGKTRRAAKMQSLRIDHPDIREFITCKPEQERLAHILIDAGVDASINGLAYNTVHFQNTNLSVRLTDNFMKAVREGKDWQTIPVFSKDLQMPAYPAKDLMKLIAEGTWFCGDPGVQYHDTINCWHTCPKSGPINASNPCSEYMFIDDSACNLASLNLMKFRTSDGGFNVESFGRAVKTVGTLQDILVDSTSYPSPKIAENAHRFRPLGLGYANLGAWLMSQGLAYDSDAGRATAAAVTALMTAKAYENSTELAEKLGTFEEFGKNKEPMLKVMKMHQDALTAIDATKLPRKTRVILEEAVKTWDNVLIRGEKYGFRNAQATVLAPTGTIGFYMDCDTTGIEPDLALVKYKTLVGGGQFKIVNQTVPLALESLGYTPTQIKGITDHIAKNDTIEGAPGLKDEHLPVFDCAFKPANGKRSIDYMGHIRMMAAAQPFLSGAISKTVNMPKDSTVEDILRVYDEAHTLGLKAVAIYRDGSKKTQPLNTSQGGLEKKMNGNGGPVRRRMPQTRNSVTHKFEIAGGEEGGPGTEEGYVTVGKYDNGKPGEIFVIMGQEGTSARGWADAWATTLSMCLQYGVPLEKLAEKFSHMRFPPSGMVIPQPEQGELDVGRDPIRFARSPPDYILRWIKQEFLGNRESPPLQMDAEKMKQVDTLQHTGMADLLKRMDTKCPHCNGPGIKTGKCDTFCIHDNILIPGGCSE